MSDHEKKIFVAGHQPHYLPWIGYFNKIYQSDIFCFADSVQFNKKWFQNRNKIRTHDGEKWLTVPVKTKSKLSQRIKDVEVDNSVPWRRKHWKTIYISYSKAPFFSLYADFFEDMYRREWKKLAELDEYIIRGVLSFLNINKKVVKASDLGVRGEKTALLIDICKKTGADGYLSGTGGAHSYVDLSLFEEAGFLHKFQEFEHPTYPQVHGRFVPKVAILDLLFNCGSESEKYVKREN